MTAATERTWDDFVEAEQPSGSGARRVARLSPGTLIADKYQVRGTLGIGGWAVVYEAEHVELEHDVAIKIMHVEDGAPDSALERFRREARLSASVRHRNVLEVYDVGVLPDGSPFLIMERLQGEDLDQHLGRGKLPIGAVVELGQQLTAALAALADQGIVHRDIKPHNLMLHREADGEVVVKLVDFGISKGRPLPVPSRTLTMDGMVIGTPHYMAPEQIRGETVDHRADLYAASVVLYEALTGDAPFDAPAAGTLLASILRDDPVSPREIRPNCPPALERIVMRGMAKDPSARYQDPREMLEDLQALPESLSLPRGSGAWTAPDTAQSSPTQGPLLRWEAEDVLRDMHTRPVWKRRAVLWAAGGLLVAVLSWTGATYLSQPAETGAIVHGEAPEADRAPPVAAAADAPAEEGIGTGRATQEQPSEDEAPPGKADTKAAPARARALARKALGAYARGQLPRARVLYRRALRADPGHAGAWRGLGLVSARMGHRDEARRALKRYLRIRPRASDAGRIRARLEQL